ncbi:MAG: ATP-binding protein, partial [Pseudolabrys sp.]
MNCGPKEKYRLRFAGSSASIDANVRGKLAAGQGRGEFLAKRRKAKRLKPRKPARKIARKANTARAQNSAIEASLAGVAHDIRTPLTGVLALAELLAASDLGERERQWANAIKSGAEHLAALTTLIIDAAKAGVTGLTLRREPFSPRRLAETVGRALSARAESRGIKAEIAIARDLPRLVAGDEMRLRAVLENLADNAVKFTGQGGVGFAAGAEIAARGRIRLSFIVTDSGIGLSKTELARLFKPFMQASEAVARRYGGAGLGLMFVKRIARAMGGDLTVTSVPGRGSTFRVSVLVEPVEAWPGLATTDGVPAGRTRSLRVLCAEDNPYGRVVMNTILTELGHRADFVETGDAAVKSAAGGSYDVVLMDVTLPIMDGLEAAKQIRALPGAASRIPIVGISGRSEPDAPEAVRAAGMNFCFPQPVRPVRLAQGINKLSLRDGE